MAISAIPILSDEATAEAQEQPNAAGSPLDAERLSSARGLLTGVLLGAAGWVGILALIFRHR